MNGATHLNFRDREKHFIKCVVQRFFFSQHCPFFSLSMPSSSQLVTQSRFNVRMASITDLLLSNPAVDSHITYTHLYLLVRTLIGIIQTLTQANLSITCEPRSPSNTPFRSLLREFPSAPTYAVAGQHGFHYHNHITWDKNVDLP